MSDEQLGMTRDCGGCGESVQQCVAGKLRGWGRCCEFCEEHPGAHVLKLVAIERTR